MSCSWNTGFWKAVVGMILVGLWWVLKGQTRREVNSIIWVTNTLNVCTFCAPWFKNTEVSPIKMMQQKHIKKLMLSCVYLRADDEHLICTVSLFCQPADWPQLCNLFLLPHIDGHVAAAMPLQELCQLHHGPMECCILSRVHHKHRSRRRWRLRYVSEA